MSKVVLCMIVKNESKIIERCLHSVLPHVDGYVICDTGSSDNTEELIKNVAAEYNVPGIVYNHTWKNFGYNRTLAARAAKGWASDFFSTISDTYLLFMDADMLLEINDTNWREQLSSPMYNVLQKHGGSLQYYNTRLVHASKNIEFIGVTHEYVRCS